MSYYAIAVLKELGEILCVYWNNLRLIIFLLMGGQIKHNVVCHSALVYKITVDWCSTWLEIIYGSRIMYGNICMARELEKNSDVVPSKQQR